jgi:hypothetical protein
VSDRAGVDQGGIAADDPALLEPSHPLEAGPWREADPVGERLVRDPAVRLQLMQDCSVDPVERRRAPETAGRVRGRVGGAGHRIKAVKRGRKEVESLPPALAAPMVRQTARTCR